MARIDMLDMLDFCDMKAQMESENEDMYEEISIVIDKLRRIECLYDSWKNLTLDLDSPRAMRHIGDILEND